jgi:hypothetical protein
MPNTSVAKIDYERKLPHNRSRLARFNVVVSLVADAALLVSILILNAGRWGPYLKPPGTIYWAEPVFRFGSMLLGLIGIVSAGVVVLRPAPAFWKVLAAAASLAYWAGFTWLLIGFT